MHLKSLRIVALVTLLVVPLACDSGTDPVIPASVELTADVDLILAGQSTQLTVIALDEDDDPIAAPDITFTSSNESVATVNDEGLVTGVGDGDVTITAAAGDQSDAVDLFIFDPDDPCGAGLQVFPGEPVRSTLETGDCDEIFNDGSFVDLWWFEVDQQTAVTIEMTAVDFDAYLWLEDDEINLLADDDDSAGGTDAEIQITLEAGRYWILANQWPAESESAPPPEGPYTLTLTTGTAADGASSAFTANARMDARVRMYDGNRSLERVRRR